MRNSRLQPSDGVNQGQAWPCASARLAGTPSKSRSSEHGRLRACELAVRDAPRDVACGGERGAGQSATRAAGSGDVGSQCPRANRPFTGPRPPPRKLAMFLSWHHSPTPSMLSKVQCPFFPHADN